LSADEQAIPHMVLTRALPAATLEQKLNDFAAGLMPDEQRVAHDVVHLAYEGAEALGFAVPSPQVPVMGNPCDRGKITFPSTFQMLGDLHVSLHPTTTPPRPSY
jgi:hypothetical protein